jgi:NTP pyrophosphatase (non-canonical NTP hydrolase)
LRVAIRFEQVLFARVIMDFERAQARARRFVEEREWTPFHTPKNLAQALAGEVGELSEIFQWLSEAESSQLDDRKQRLVQEELADIMIYVMRLADVLAVDLWRAVEAKQSLNELRYPVETSKGDPTSYAEKGEGVDARSGTL